MKKSLITKIIVTLILTVAIIALGSTVLAANSDYTVLKKTDTEYVIYLKSALDKNFEFAYANSELTSDDGLDYISSAKDQKDGLSIAYVDDTLYASFVEGKDATYIWAKDAEGYIAEGIKLDLNDNITEEIVTFVKDATSRIDVKTGVNEKEEVKDGIKYITTTGKIDVPEKAGATYSYAVKANEGDYAKLTELGDKINSSNSENTVVKLENSKEFYDLYQKLVAGIEWAEVKNNEILQPEDAKEGDKYVVFIKEKTADGEKTDVKFMTSTVKTEQEYAKEQQVIKETTLLPKTYDSIALFVVLGLAVVLFVVLLIARKKSNKESK